MEIEEIKIEGNSKQDKREDDNLYNTKEAYFINGTLTQNGITAEKKENGSIEFNGTATNDTYFKLDIRNLEDGRYYFYNFNTTEQSYETYYMLVQGKKGEAYYNARGYETETFEKNSEIYEEDFSCIFTIKKGYEAKRLEVYPMISKVEQTKYKPYGTSPSEENPSEIRSVGKNGKIEIKIENKTEKQNYIIPVQEPMYKGDYLGEDGEHHRMKVREIDGTEDWRIYPNREEDFLRNPQSFYIAGGIKEMKATNFNYVQANQMSNWSLCSRYPARQIARGIYEGIECGGNNIYMCYKKFKEYTIEELKQYLAEQYAKGTPLKVIYELKEEKIIPYTEEQKQEIEKLAEARTYKNETIIYSTDEVEPIIEVKYRKDIETMINNITKAIIEIGGV